MRHVASQHEDRIVTEDKCDVTPPTYKLRNFEDTRW